MGDENKSLKKYLKDNMFLIFALFFLIPVIVLIVEFITTTNREVELYVFIIIFSLVDLVLWIIAIKQINNNVKVLLVDRRGREYDATVIGISEEGCDADGLGKYAVSYKWLDENDVEYNSTTEYIYSHEEAYFLLKMSVVKIKARGKFSVIISNPKNSCDVPKSIANKVASHMDYRKRTLCEYCNKPISKVSKRCPHCKALVNNKSNDSA
ncbi:MAG: hypothetical protein E7356_02760 [Clostridiales bacterium]|nr:hypothetical protein [Clostridiales bacterium]